MESEPVMIELVVRQVEPEIIAKLKERADQHCHSVEDELRQILKDALLNKSSLPMATSFEQYLQSMPSVGTDDDFSRIEGSIRDVDLTQ